MTSKLWLVILLLVFGLIGFLALALVPRTDHSRAPLSGSQPVSSSANPVMAANGNFPSEVQTASSRTASSSISESPVAVEEESWASECTLRARSAIEGSLFQQMEVDALVELAESLLSAEVGPALTEPNVLGSLVFPLKDTPAGVEADLSVRYSSNQAFKNIVSLDVRMEQPDSPYLLEGSEREPPELTITAWSGHDDELIAMSFLAQVPSTGDTTAFGLGFEESEIPVGMMFTVFAKDPYAWDAKTNGILMGKPVKDTGGSVTGYEPAEFDRFRALSAGMLQMYGTQHLR